MAKERKNTTKTDGGIFRVFELFTESMGWLQIVASPLLIGLIAGSIIYFSDPTPTRLVLGIIVATLGLLSGVFWATKQWKGKGTIRFMSRIMATPELDHADGKRTIVQKNDDDEKANG